MAKLNTSSANPSTPYTLPLMDKLMTIGSRIILMTVTMTVLRPMLFCSCVQLSLRSILVKALRITKLNRYCTRDDDVEHSNNERDASCNNGGDKILAVLFGLDSVVHLHHCEGKDAEECQQEEQRSNQKRNGVNADNFSGRSAQRDPLHIFWLRSRSNFRFYYLAILTSEFEIISRLEARRIKEKRILTVVQSLKQFFIFSFFESYKYIKILFPRIFTSFFFKKPLTEFLISL